MGLMMGGKITSSYHNHLFQCNRCFSPSKKYCEDGKKLRISAIAEFIVFQGSSADREREYLHQKKLNPKDAVVLAAEVRRLLSEVGNG